MTHFLLWVIIQPAAAEPFKSIGDRPLDHIAYRVMVKMQIEREVVIESDILRIDRVGFRHAHGEGDNLSVLAPNEKADLVRHPLAKLDKIGFRQLFEVQVRPIINLQVKRIELADESRNISDNLHGDR